MTPVVAAPVMNLLPLLLIVILCDFVLAAPKYHMNSSCQPPRGDSCVEIRKCPYFDDLLNKTNIPRPRHVIRIIRDHQCGFHGSIPEVCCTLPSPTTSAPATTEPTAWKLDVDETAPSDEQHQNLHLLPRSDCGYVSNDFRITNGAGTSLYEFPWMALIAYTTKDGIDFRCGGTVINNRYVLTAAHCISNIAGVRLGEHNIYTLKDCDSFKCAPPVQDFYVEDIMVHPDYIGNTHTNDIALLRLATPANFSNDNVKPICLPLGDLANFNLDGKFATVSGWGVTETGYKSSELLKTSVPVVPNKECRKVYEKSTPISDKQLCAGGYRGRDSCAGDSGGPLKHIGMIDGLPRYVQHGIVSFGPKLCGIVGQPGVYTKITHYLPWILDMLKPSD